MKKIALIVLSITCIMGSYSVAYGSQTISVLVNGKPVVAETPAVIVSDRTMLPFRAVFNALGLPDNSIRWNPNSKSIEVWAQKKYIFLAIGSNFALINDGISDSMVQLDAPPYIEMGRTMVPVRFVAETLGADVTWQEKSRTVIITK
jgi:hypothetical protein